MSEFIVWDKHHKNFTTDLTISGITVNEALKENDDWACFQYTSKMDITGKMIYADCSIVEFDLLEELHKTIRLRGVFTWNDIDLRYEIDISKKYEPYLCLFYDDVKMDNFKIIGTLQQDKELLGVEV